MTIWHWVALWAIPFAAAGLAWILIGPIWFPVGFIVGMVVFAFAHDGMERRASEQDERSKRPRS